MRMAIRNWRVKSLKLKAKNKSKKYINLSMFCVNDLRSVLYE